MTHCSSDLTAPKLQRILFFYENYVSHTIYTHDAIFAARVTTPLIQSFGENLTFLKQYTRSHSKTEMFTFAFKSTCPERNKTDPGTLYKIGKKLHTE